MKTILHTYKFDIREPDQKAAWCELKAKFKGGPRCHGPVLADVYSPFQALDGQEIELETKHLFDNQWSTATLRVFDWALEFLPYNKFLMRGHYLEQTAEMREIRRNTDRCGYCGTQEPAAKGYIFCPHCIDSEYLKESDLKLTRMKAVDYQGEREELSEAERAHLLPLYREAQTHGTTERGKARIAKLRVNLQTRYHKKIASANTERDGYSWLIDNGFGQLAADNVIFYDHTGRFGFGWRTPLDQYTLDRVLESISEFGWPYDIKTADGRTLSGN